MSSLSFSYIIGFFRILKKQLENLLLSNNEVKEKKGSETFLCIYLFEWKMEVKKEKRINLRLQNILLFAF